MRRKQKSLYRKAAAASDAQTVVNAESLSSLKGRDGSWIVAAKTKQYHWRREDLGGWMSVRWIGEARVMQAAARRGELRRTHPVLAKKCSALDGTERRRERLL